MENSKGNTLSREKILSVCCLIVFVLFFIFACMSSTIPFGAKLVGTFGVIIYPILIVLTLICFAKFLGLNYKRSVKATFFMVSFLYCLLLVIHSIRTFSLLDSVVSSQTFKEYLTYSYSNLSLLGSVGCLFAGAISYLLGGMGAIVVYVILATIFIGLFVDYQLYGKYEQKHIRKLHSKKMREKVLQSDKNVNEDGKPNYSFSNSDKKYKNEDVLAEITADFSDENMNGTQFPSGEIVDEITDNQYYDENQSYYHNVDGSYHNEINGYYDENNNYYVDETQNYPNTQYTNQENQNYLYNNAFGNDSVQTQEFNRFSNNSYGEQKYPNVYDENEERRKFLQATFNVNYNSNSEMNNSEETKQFEDNSYSNYSDNTQETINNSYNKYDDSERISKTEMEWKFNDDDFNYYSFNDDTNVENSSDNFTPTSVDEQISEILNSNDSIESSIKNDYDSNYNFSSSSSSNETDYSVKFDSYETPYQSNDYQQDKYQDVSNFDNNINNFSSKINLTSNDNYSNNSSSIIEPSFSDLQNVKIPAKEPEKKVSSSLKMGMKSTKYIAPTLDLLAPIQIDNGNYDEEQTRKAKGLEMALDAFNIPVSVANIVRGAKITRYELSVPLGVSIKKIPSYELDIKKTLAAKTITIHAPIPGTEFVGVELENDTFTNVYQRELFESDAFKNCTEPLPIAIGKDISGEVIVDSLTKMVHALIAGQTGSGKSVFIHSLVMSLIYKYSPEDLRLIMIDPKKVEFNRYNGLPHLLTPEVVLGNEKAVNALKWCVKEMDRRYDLMSKSGYNNIVPYNNSELVKSGQFERLPYIVIIVDEFAEVIMSNKKDAEYAIQRLTQLARACGMHLVLATQRPSVDVMSGIIKNNVPTRIAFSLSSPFDSKTILGTVGAENLLGKGDMLYKPNGTGAMFRLQAAYCSDEEIKRVIDFDIKNNVVDYDDTVSNMINSEEGSSYEGGGDGDNIPPPKDLDPYFKTAIKIFIQNGSASASYLQRRLQIGYARAGRIMDQLENRGYISQASGAKVRKILITPEQFKKDFNEDIDFNTSDD